MVEPLHVDERLEAQEHRRPGHVVARWLKKFIPRLAYHGPPYARLSVETQLRQRSSVVKDVWRKYGSMEEVLQILEILREELGLPNNNFIPEDPLVLLIGSGYDKDDVYLFLELENRFKVNYADKDRVRIRNDDWTLGVFVNDLLERARAR